MRTVALILLLGCCLTATAQAQTPPPWMPAGTVREGLTVDSKKLGYPVRYTVYLPPDYETSDRRYPVVYLLHGYTDDDTGWLQFGEANRIADLGIAAGQLPPMVLVMPDAKVTWYVNDHSGRVPYEDFFVEELIPHVEASYRVRTERRYRAVAGLSMGGFGALVYAMRHPDLFVACAPMSAALYLPDEVAAYDQARWNEVEGPVYGVGLKGRQRLTPHWRQYNVLDMVARTPAETLRRVRYYIDCGDDDYLYKGNAYLHVALREKEVPHEYRVRNGHHNWDYWRSGLPDALAFIGKSFH